MRVKHKIKLNPYKPRFTKRHSKKAGLPSGTLVHIGEKKIDAVQITYIDYDEQNFEEKQAVHIEECFKFKDTKTVTWINIDGIHDIELIEKLGKHFELHPLILEDILNTDQRPKLEDFDNYLFIVLKMLSYNDEKQMDKLEQVRFTLMTSGCTCHRRRSRMLQPKSNLRSNCTIDHGIAVEHPQANG